MLKPCDTLIRASFNALTSAYFLVDASWASRLSRAAEASRTAEEVAAVVIAANCRGIGRLVPLPLGRLLPRE